MNRVCFVCLGNICRSTMAEFLFKKLVAERGVADEFIIESRATSDESVGWQVHHGTAMVLDRFGIDYSKKRAVQLKIEDGNNFDYFVCMDDSNMTNTARILSIYHDAEIIKLLNLTSRPRDVLDPYYTRNFELAYQDITEGLNALMLYLGYDE